MNHEQEREFLLYNEIYNLYIYVFPLLTKFPKSEKFTLRQEIEKTFIDLLLSVFEYKKIKQDNKKNIVKRISYLFDKIKFLVRLTTDLHIFPQKHYLYFLTKTEIIGKLIGGLLRKI